MNKVKIVKRCYTSPQNVRIVSSGIYELTDFNKEEIDFLQSLNAVRYIEVVKPEKEEKIIDSAPVTIVKEENPPKMEISIEPVADEDVEEIVTPDEAIPLPPVRPRKPRRRRKIQNNEENKE